MSTKGGNLQAGGLAGCGTVSFFQKADKALKPKRKADVEKPVDKAYFTAF